MKARILTVALAALCALPALAANVETQQRGVQYKDLDLSTEAGRKELDRRLDAAAREVCGMDENHVGSRLAPTESRECYREARDRLDERIAALTKAEKSGA